MHKTITALLLLIAFALSTNAQLLPKDAVPEKVAEGYKFTEGPALGPDGCIYFTDIPKSLILKFDPTKNETTTFRQNTKQTNGLMWHNQNLYMCSHGARAVRYYMLNERERATHKRANARDNRVESDEDLFGPRPQNIDFPISIIDSWSIYSDDTEIKEVKLNSPNELAIDRDGNIYFTDPRYGNRDNMEMKTEGVYYHGDAHHDNNPNSIYTLTRRIDAELTRPNGIVFSPDESILYVADHGANWIYAYDIESPGKVKNKRKFAQLNGGKGGGSDGMCVDAQGRLYATGHGKVWAFEPTGQLVATIDVGRQTTNCTFGADGKTLYITANKGLYRITLNTDAPLEHTEKNEN